MSAALAALYRVAEERNAAVLDARLRAASGAGRPSVGRAVHELDTVESVPGHIVRHGVVQAWELRRMAEEDREALWGGPPPPLDGEHHFTRLRVPGLNTPADLVEWINQ